MKIKTFGLKEFYLLIILEKESIKTALTAFLQYIAKYPTILGNNILDSVIVNLLFKLANIYPQEVSVSINEVIPTRGFPIFCSIMQNPNIKI